MASSLEELLAKEGFRRKTQGKPLYLHKDKHKSCSPPAHSRIKTVQRTNSDPFRYSSNGGLPRSDSNSSNHRSRDSLFKREHKELTERRGSDSDHDLQRRIRSNITALECEIVELDPQGNEIDNAHALDKKETFSEAIQSKERSKDRLGNIFGENSMKKSEKPAVTSHDRFSRGLRITKSINGETRQNAVHAATPPALDEAAIQALVSILTGHIKKYLKDTDFRDTLRRNCFSSLNFVESHDHITENNVIANLAEAIESVEKAAQGNASAQELKAASLQLSVITGLNSNNFKDDFTSGVSNSKLSACAHIYLSILYKMQNKDKISAKHVLQVFCDAPYQARNTLPEVWDYLFSPHLIHLKVSDSLTERRKLKILKNAYDSGTYKFAVYYKDWLNLMEGVEAPSLPYINISLVPESVIPQESSSDLESFFSLSPTTSSRSIISKKLYDEVFGRSSKAGVCEVEENSSDSSAAEIKETLTYSSVRVEHLHQVSTKMVQNYAFSPEDSPLSRAQEIHTKESVLTLKKLATSTFDHDRIHTSEVSIHDTLPIKIKTPFEESERSCEYSDEGSVFTSIPHDFICPLTGQMFEEPVTLVSGQTFEREAIKKWFENGNITCPVTRKRLECHAVPLTNYILKRVIDSWKQVRYS